MFLSQNSISDSCNVNLVNLPKNLWLLHFYMWKYYILVSNKSGMDEKED